MNSCSDIVTSLELNNPSLDSCNLQDFKTEIIYLLDTSTRMFWVSVALQWEILIPGLMAWHSGSWELQRHFFFKKGKKKVTCCYKGNNLSLGRPWFLILEHSKREHKSNFNYSVFKSLALYHNFHYYTERTLKYFLSSLPSQKYMLHPRVSSVFSFMAKGNNEIILKSIFLKSWGSTCFLYNVTLRLSCTA